MPAKRKLNQRFKRFGQWLKQVVLLGRADWRKASDDASPPRLSRSEREELRPQFNVSAIKPRKLSAAARAEEPPTVAPGPVVASATPDGASGDPLKPPKSRSFRRHHRERPRQIAVNPLSAFTPEKLPASRLERLFEKFFGRRD